VRQTEEIYLTCPSAPNIHLAVQKGRTVSQRQRHRYPRQSLFIDGVFTGPPFFDNKRRQYSLDHHAGCVRAFTRASCEQAAVLLLQGLPLLEGIWTLHLNQPDADSVLAAWILLNHVELLREDRRLLRQVMPFVLVEGNIDAFGFDMGMLTGLSPEAFEEKKAAIGDLLARLKKIEPGGRDPAQLAVDYAQAMLGELDRLLLPPEYLEKLIEIEELSRLFFQGDKLAVLARSKQGIYAVENHFKERYPKKLALLVLDLGDGFFTLRIVDPFLAPGLGEVYALLNSADQNVREADRESNHWGGSEDIGGAPRSTGSSLSGPQILAAIATVYGQRQSLWAFFQRHIQRIKDKIGRNRSP